MKILIRVCAFLLTATAGLGFAGCYWKDVRLNTDADTVVYSPGEVVTVDFPPEVTDTAPPETDEASHGEIGAAVYWVKESEVWHTAENCPSLSRSKAILSGSMNEALNMGKIRACKRCS